jgi:hypothetical protein
LRNQAFLQQPALKIPLNYRRYPILSKFNEPWTLPLSGSGKSKKQKGTREKNKKRTVAISRART